MQNKETQIEFYHTIENEAVAEFKDRGSRFIAYAFSISSTKDVKEKLLLLKKEHIKANHFCYAYRLGYDKTNFRTVDDGEPSNSAGKPILAQIDSKELSDVCVVVVRYFGGTLLGVPGLINAYKTATSLALQTTPIIKKYITQNIELEFEYALENKIMNIAKQHNAQLILKEQLLFCRYIFSVTIKSKSDFIKNIEDIPVTYRLVD